MANLWTEFAAHRSEALSTNGKEPQNSNKLVVAATFEKAITYVFAGRLIRNAEVRGSTPLCSTSEPHFFNNLQAQLRETRFPQLANIWPEKTASDRKEQ